jgi:hypothetical protein
MSESAQLRISQRQRASRTGWEREYVPDLQPVSRENNEIPAQQQPSLRWVSHEKRAFTERERHDPQHPRKLEESVVGTRKAPQVTNSYHWTLERTREATAFVID